MSDLRYRIEPTKSVPAGRWQIRTYIEFFNYNLTHHLASHEWSSPKGNGTIQTGPSRPGITFINSHNPMSKDYRPYIYINRERMTIGEVYKDICVVAGDRRSVNTATKKVGLLLNEWKAHIATLEPENVPNPEARRLTDIITDELQDLQTPPPQPVTWTMPILNQEAARPTPVTWEDMQMDTEMPPEPTPVEDNGLMEDADEAIALAELTHANLDNADRALAETEAALPF